MPKLPAVEEAERRIRLDHGVKPTMGEVDGGKLVKDALTCLAVPSAHGDRTYVMYCA